MIKSEGPQDFDPQAPETFDSPYEVYADLRQRCPVAASGVVLINLIGNISSLINSSVIGYVRESTGSYQVPAVMLSVILCCAAVLVAIIASIATKAPLPTAGSREHPA